MARPNRVRRAAAAMVRIRRVSIDESIVTLLAPREGLSVYCRHTPFVQSLVTVHRGHWSQIEKRLQARFGGDPLSQTTITAPANQHSIEIDDSVSDGRRTLRRTRTRIGPRGEIEWESRDGNGSLLESGHGIDGAGEWTAYEKESSPTEVDDESVLFDPDDKGEMTIHATPTEVDDEPDMFDPDDDKGEMTIHARPTPGGDDDDKGEMTIRATPTEVDDEPDMFDPDDDDKSEMTIHASPTPGDDPGPPPSDQPLPSEDDQGDGDGDGRGSPGPSFPGGIIGRIFKGFRVSRGGGGVNEWNEGNGPEVTAEQAARIIAAAHHAPAPSGGDSRGTDGTGTGRPDIVIAVPMGAIEDWNDHPRPETIQRFTQWILANAATLDASAQALKDLRGALSNLAAKR